MRRRRVPAPRRRRLAVAAASCAADTTEGTDATIDWTIDVAAARHGSD